MANSCNIAVHLVARKLAAFTWLGALRNLDLQLVGVDQILGGHAKAAGCNLLDRGSEGVTIWQSLEPVALLTALTDRPASGVCDAPGAPEHRELEGQPDPRRRGGVERRVLLLHAAV